MSTPQNALIVLLHRHIGGLESIEMALTDEVELHRHIGGLEKWRTRQA